MNDNITLSRKNAYALCLLLFIISLFITPLHILRSLNFKAQSLTASDISAEEKRFSEVRKFLPIDQPIGYLSDNNSAIANKEPLPAKHFTIAQYALIPAILQVDTTPEFVLANFPDKPLTQNQLKKENLYIAKKFSKGVYILKHKN
jgi:hypothetical protein